MANTQGRRENGKIVFDAIADTQGNSVSVVGVLISDFEFDNGVNEMIVPAGTKVYVSRRLFESTVTDSFFVNLLSVPTFCSRVTRYDFVAD